MACSDDQQPNFKHFCKVCKKGFMCGRALGGHMRAHGVGDEIEGLDDGDDPTTDWDSSFVSSPEMDEDEDVDGYGRRGGGSGWCKRKRSSRVCASESEEDIALAKCLMALSNTRVDLMDIEPEGQKRNPIFSPVFLSNFTKPPPSRVDKAKGVVANTTPKGMFECKACKKVFNSHQALGGHRASHKNVKGCFATRNDQFDENLTDEDVIIHSDVKHTSTYQSDHEPSTGSVALAGRKSKVHKCTICSRVFASGQALGGHKRCHWLTSNYTPNNYIGKFNFHEHIEQLHQRALAIPKELDLKLNLPVSCNTTTTTRQEPQVPMNEKEYHKHQANKNNGDLHDDHIATTTTIESVDGEDENKMKLAKLSELKDMNNTNGSSSSWLQVGIGSVTDVAPDP
ncbi:putative transcription factor C2H2 family [Helianthus annuus]|uniref:Putative zinc finger, C2H2-like protein n=1 Tax=Helianthus annuus TaxID=4232 RepID=A0A251SXP0_HELAN|nr:zinc finger protein ZAT9 [Helianthus annuus]KAF5775555.1 putative transcription factor C2H2 family [Helianthus annuus]